MLRGADMTKCDVYIQTEAGFDVLSGIGELECVQFVDMNWDVPPIDKRYVSDLCRCADMERNLNYMRDEITKEGIKIPRLRDLSHIKPLHPTEMFDFENMIDSWTKDVKDMYANNENLKKLKSETKEMHYFLHNLDPILGDLKMGKAKLPSKMLESEGKFDRRKLKIITGVVERSTSYPFETMLWRISHGNIYYKEAQHDDSFNNLISGRKVRKVAFVIICYGEELHRCILKVCNGFNVSLYRWPESREDRLSTLDDLSNRMQDMDKVLQRTKYQRAVTFRNIAIEWETWMTQVMKAKAVYYQLNLFNMDISNNTLIGQCWLPDQRYDEVEKTLESTSKTVGARSFMAKTATADIPPTYYRTNRFTEAFQSIISSYQIGRYKELNPGIFAIVSFPFLFGVMFGDVGHGFLLFIYGFWMVNNEKKYMYRKSTNEVWNLIFKGRYMILMMGLWAMFMGFIYNEWFSQTTKMMTPFWLNTYDTKDFDDYDKEDTFPIEPKKGSVGFVYTYGMEPGIKLSPDGFRIENSVKMKQAIIFGVVHVVLGLFLSMWNYIYFKKYYAIYLHFLPKLLFVLCIYGYLCYLIFHKWFIPVYIKEYKKHPHFAKLADVDYRTYLPNLRDTFLHYVLWSEMREDHIMVEFATSVLKFKPTPFSYDADVLETVLYHIALACFPILLFGSPIYFYIKNRIATSQIERETCNPFSMRGQDSEELKKHQEFNTRKLLLHRLWRTMEFAFAVVSHMASYLRLWALSLAHTLLSDFLWQMILRNLALRDHTANGIWKLYFVFFLWALITVFFLVIMDSLAVFIHVLRLHWIEFMSKFFMGNGVPFRPFAFSTVLDEPDVKREEETAAICKLRRARESAGDY